jgi:antitoxin HicB
MINLGIFSMYHLWYTPAMAEPPRDVNAPVLSVVFYRTKGGIACRAWTRSRAMNQQHLGSDFDDFLREQRLLETTEAAATKRVIAHQIAGEMRNRKLSKSEMASRMRTSRAALERLLDPANSSVTLSTLERAAAAVGKKLKVELS